MNKPPTVSIIEDFQNGQQVNEDFVDFSWVGEDDDGYVLKFKYILSSNINYFQETSATSKSFTDLSSGDYFFSVLAMDNQGEWSQPSEVSFSVYKEYFLNLQPRTY